MIKVWEGGYCRFPQAGASANFRYAQSNSGSNAELQNTKKSTRKSTLFRGGQIAT